MTGPDLEFNTHFDVLDRYDIVMQVQGCENGHIALSATPEILDVATYDVVIGANGNTMCVILDGIMGLELNSGECSLDCADRVNFRAFIRQLMTARCVVDLTFIRYQYIRILCPKVL